MFGSIGAALGGILLQMLMKSLGYEFIADAAVMIADSWAKTTKTHKDDLVVERWGVAIGASEAVIKQLKESSAGQ